MPPPPTDRNEAETRKLIDKKLEAAGWEVQDPEKLNLMAGASGVHGVAVREYSTGTGPGDYMLFIQGKACGVIEAKREGASLGAVDRQSGRYAASDLGPTQRWVPEDKPLPFLYEATNEEIRFRDERDPAPRSRELFHYHRPETLLDWLEQGSSLRARLRELPELDTKGLRQCQADAIGGIESSLKRADSHMLLQMATGAGKTFAAVTEVYRLARHARVRRVLFLVDRGNLGRQAKKEFDQYTTPDDGRKFTELYNVNILNPGGIGAENKVTISTIQRLYSMLSKSELDEEAEEHSGYETEATAFNKEPAPVEYNPDIPIEAFDVIIIDECHRSIYNRWRQVLEYFDAFLIGLTATPTRKTIGFFHQNLVSEYTYENAVIDRVAVGYDVYRILTKKTVEGDTIEAGTTVQVRDKLTRQKRWELLDKDEEYEGRQLDRSVIAPNQIRTIMQTFRDRVFKDIFPGRGGEWLPKTLIFAKDDDHADRIVDTVREVFGESNDFCRKITYKVGKKTAEDGITGLRTNPHLRVGVTVDMIATGTDIKPLEIVMFMRDVKSPAYYEQMKGRGSRVLGKDELRMVTPDAGVKTRFVLVDCVGVTESDKTESRSLESKPSVSTEKLMLQIARGDRHSDSLRTLGNRLLRLDMKLDEQQRQKVNELIKQSVPPEVTAQLEKDFAKPDTLANVAANLVHGTRDDALVTEAQAATGREEVTDEEIQATFKPRADVLMYPFHSPEVREQVETLCRKAEQYIDPTPDTLVDTQTGYTKETAEGMIKSWRKFIQDHQNDIDAIELIYKQPYRRRHLSHDMIQQLVDAIEQPPYDIAPVEVWKAYEKLEKARVQGAPPERKLPLLISLIRLETGLSNVLEPFTELVNQRFNDWLEQRQRTRSWEGEGTGDDKPGSGPDGKPAVFTPEQIQWLHLIRDQIANNAEITEEDLDYVPFNQQGGLLKARQLFGDELKPLIDELNGYLIA